MAVNHSFPFIDGATARPAASLLSLFRTTPHSGKTASALFLFFSISISMSPLPPTENKNTHPHPTPNPHTQTNVPTPHYLLHHHDPLGWNASGATPGSSDAALSSSRQAMRMRSEEAGP